MNYTITASSLACKRDLLSYRPVFRLVTKRWFPGLLQGVSLLLFVLLIVIGWQDLTEETRYTNLANLLIWVFWWPALIFFALFAARAWCTVCPLGLVAKYAGRFGLQLKVPRSFVKHKIGIVLSFFLLHSVVISFDIHHIPRMTALYLLLLMTYGLVFALIFEKGAFCGSFCPLNGFIGTYSLLSPTKLSAANPKMCKLCRENYCLGACSHNLYMGAAEKVDQCLLCFDCVKSCPQNNISFRLQKPLQGLWQPKNHKIANALLVTILLGIMIQEVGEEWELFEMIATYVPNSLVQLGLPASLFGYEWLNSIWLNFLMPLLILGFSAGAASLLAGQWRIKQHFQSYAMSFVPLVFSLHFAKLWHTFNTKSTLLPYAINNTVGPYNFNIAEQAPPTLNALLTPESVEGFFLLFLIAIGVLSTLFVISKITQSKKETRSLKHVAIPFYVLAVFLGASFSVVIANWFGIITI